MLLLALESGIARPVLAVAQTLNDVDVRFGLTVKVTDAVAPGVSGLTAEMPSAAALHSMVVAAVWAHPAGTSDTNNLAPSWATNSKLGLLSRLGPKFVMLEVIVVARPA